jgi:hypothetical protein
MPNNFAISQVDNFLCDIGGMISDPLDMTRNSEIPLAPLFQRGESFHRIVQQIRGELVSLAN